MGEQGEPFTTGDKEHEKDYKGGVKGFIALGLSSVMFVALAFINVAAGWIDNDLANAFMLVLSSLSILSFIHQLYLWRETMISETANEDFAKKRQENSMFFFLFFYTVAYLSGVSACTKLLVGEATRREPFFFAETYQSDLLMH